jgi:hypothetical protein
MREDAIVADGLILALQDGVPLRARYTIDCDTAFRVRRVRVELLARAGAMLELRSDGSGRWSSGDGVAAPALAGCVDVDISATPFTNTLPIRRLHLAPGESAEFRVVYIPVPALTPRHEIQRYACLESHGAGGRYRYESVESGFRAELAVDADGLVRDYPGLFRRRWPLTTSPAGTAAVNAVNTAENRGGQS